MNDYSRYDGFVITGTLLFSGFRLNMDNAYTTDRRIVLSVGEIAAPSLPEDCYMSQIDANSKFISVMRFALTSNTYRDDCSRLTAGVYDALPNAENAPMPSRYMLPATYADITTWAQDQQRTSRDFMRFLKLIACFADDDNHELVGLNLVVHTVVAICKQGTVSADFIKKVVDATRADLGKDIRMNANTIENIWGGLWSVYQRHQCRGDFNNVLERNRWECCTSSGNNSTSGVSCNDDVPYHREMYNITSGL